MSDAAKNAGRAIATGDVLIVGGYGSVGRRIARLLAKDLGEHLLIAGRHQSRAARFAAELNTGACARLIDVAIPETYAAALRNVDLVVMCLDTTDLKFAHVCIANGTHYIDITATYEVIERLGYLQDLARANKVTMLCSVGLAPGLTNLLAKACVQASSGTISNIDVHILFGLGDRHGKAALDWMINRFHHPFDIHTAHGSREVWPFEDRARGRFPAPFGERATYRFDFSDQHTLPRTLGMPSVSTWTTINRPGLASLLSRLARRGVLRWYRYRIVRRLTVTLMRTLRRGSARFAVSVEAQPSSDEADVVRFTASGIGESHTTAVIAAEAVRHLLASSPSAGVFQIDELYSLRDFESALAENDILIGRPEATANASTSDNLQSTTSNPNPAEGTVNERANG